MLDILPASFILGFTFLKNLNSEFLYTEVYFTDQNSKIPVWPNGWMFVYELGGCGIESSCSHSKF